MTRVWSRIHLALRRGLARADSWIAAFGFFYAGRAAANGSWIQVVLAAAVGIVFLVAAGDYAWRKGFVEGKRSTG